MSDLHVHHVRANCNTRFSSLIDMADVPTHHPADERENKFLSRSLAAFSIAHLAKIDDVTAARAVVDESNDNGIDGFFYDRIGHTAYLVQAKWVRGGTGSVDVGSILKFIEGVKDFFAPSLGAFGPKMQKKSQDVQDAIDDYQTKFVLVVAYTGKPELSADVLNPLNSEVARLNDDTDMVSVKVLKLSDLRDIVVAGASGESVDFEIMLKEFGQVKLPYQSYYGQVDLGDIVSWGKFGDRLYNKNIRSFKGSTDVNDAIGLTIKENPHHFLYFNNGITILCGQLHKKPYGGSSTDSGVFDCKDVSIINGAQTVGSIIRAFSGEEAVTTNARVIVRLISIEGCPEDFVTKITEATNTQNRIEKKDFAALDPEQSRLRDDLRLALNKEYVFRTGDQNPDPDKGCTLDEATVALACASSEITYTMQAKAAVGSLYEDIKKPPYTIFFNSGLVATKMWRAVEVLRAVESFLDGERKKKGGKERLIAVHGNRFLLHLVFKGLSPDIFDLIEEKSSKERSRIGGLCSRYLTELTDLVAKKYEKSYPANIFKNTSKCKEILKAIEDNSATSGEDRT